MSASTPPPHAQGTIRIGVHDGGAILHLSGEIDTAAVAAFESSPAPDPALRVLLVDASAVTFLNSVGARLLVRQTQAARDAGLRPKLRRPSRPVRQLLRVTGLDQLFDEIDD
jgi:anti-sigma B factor antagonist